MPRSSDTPSRAAQKATSALPNDSPREEELEEITLQLSWKHQFQFAGYYVAQQRNYFKRGGLKVTLREVDNEHDPITEVVQGNAEYGVAGPELEPAYYQGKPVRILVPILQHSPLVLITSAEVGAKGLADLPDGTTLALEPDGGLIRDTLIEAGLDPSKLNLVPHPYSTEKLRSNEIQGMSGYLTDEPFELTRAGFHYVIFSPRALTGFDFYSDVLFTSQGEQTDNPGRVERMVQASLAGWAWALSNIEETADLILAQYSKRHDRDQLIYEGRKIQELVDQNSVPLGTLDRARWQRMADVYADHGILPRGLDLSRLFPPVPIRDGTAS